MPVVASNGEMIHYEQAGSGPAVALIHDLGASTRTWKEQIRALKEQYTVIAIDSRGHGQSSANGPVGVADAAHDVKAVLDHIGLTAGHLVGIGMGGVIALSFTALWPAMVRSLALADCAAEPDENAEDLVIATREALAYISMQEFGSQYAAEHLMPTTAFDVQDDLAAAIAQMNPKTYIDAMRSTRLGHFTSMLSHIKAPTLVLVGEHDTVAPRSAAEYLTTNIPGARLEVIANAAHLSNLDNPADFNAALRVFLDTQSKVA